MPLYRAELIRRKKPLIGPQLHDVSKVLYLPFDLDDGSYARDRSGYSNHGTIYGATRVAGKINRALDFDGVDDYVEVEHDASIMPSEFTLMCWVKRLGSGSGPYPSLIEKYPYPVSSGFLLCWRPIDSKVYFYVRESAALYTYIIDPNTLATNVWVHYTATFDGNLRLYRNGSLVAGPTSGVLTSNTNPLRVGAWRDFPSYFEGIIDEVRIYNRALSQSEIKRLMNLRGV